MLDGAFEPQPSLTSAPSLPPYPLPRSCPSPTLASFAPGAGPEGRDSRQARCRVALAAQQPRWAAAACMTGI